MGDNNDVLPSYPASYTSANIISVASITSTGARSSFSNFGATSVDIGGWQHRQGWWRGNGCMLLLERAAAAFLCQTNASGMPAAASYKSHTF